MAEAAAAPVGARGVMFLPHMSGSGCPVVDARSLGAFVGLSNFAGKGDMLRAVVEGLDYQFLDIVRTMQAAGVPFDRLVVVGGAIRNKFWMQNKADVAGRCIEVPDDRGRHPARRRHAGRHRCGPVRRRAGCLRPGLPARGSVRARPSGVGAYAELFPIYKQLYPALAPVSHQLYDRFLA